MAVSNIQRIIVLFPFLLVLLGAGSFVFYFKSKKAVGPDDESKLLRSTEEITEIELRDYVETLALKIGPRHVGEYGKLQSAAIWIQSMLGESNFGYQIEKQTYEAAGKDVHNIIVEIPGQDRPEEIIVVGAHYDSIPDCPAANDNGSGVAAMLALARGFFGSINERTIRFVAFVNEEPPFFKTEKMGSLVYAQRCKARDENIVGMLSLETIGYYTDAPDSQEIPAGIPSTDYPTTGNFIAFVTRPEDAEFLRTASSAFEQTVDFPIISAPLPETVPGVSFSDQWSFWQAGYPAVMVTDTAMLRYEHYHQPTDTPDRLNYPAFTEVVRGVRGVVQQLANPGS
ncbi:MAG: M28 family peptidase [Verrucomicrobiota bacterium]